jgi:ATP-dependent helicase Lhr and Lhr-like helicase
MLLTRRLERARLRPLGFVANEYALAVWSLGDPARAIRAGTLSLADLFDEDMLGDDLEAWLAESALMKRMFRQCAIISGLIQRRTPGEEKKQRQMTISTDLVYDVLRRHQADHILLRAARQEAAAGLLDIRRLATMLARVKSHVVHAALDHVSPLAPHPGQTANCPGVVPAQKLTRLFCRSRLSIFVKAREQPDNAVNYQGSKSWSRTIF